MSRLGGKHEELIHVECKNIGEIGAKGDELQIGLHE